MIVLGYAGKNGMVVDKMYYLKDEFAYLHDGSAIKLGPACFYFHLPSPNSDEDGEEEGEGDSENSDEEDEGERAGMVDEEEEVENRLAYSSAHTVAAVAPPKEKKPGRYKPEDKGATYADMVHAVSHQAS